MSLGNDNGKRKPPPVWNAFRAADKNLLIMILIAIVLASIAKLNTIEDQIQDITENRYPKAELANKIVLVTFDVARKIATT